MIYSFALNILLPLQEIHLGEARGKAMLNDVSNSRSNLTPR